MNIKEAIITLLYQESLDAKLTALTDIQLSFKSGVIFDTCEDVRHDLSLGEATGEMQGNRKKKLPDLVDIKGTSAGHWQVGGAEGTGDAE